MVSVGKTETGRPIAKTLKPKAYFATYNLAYTALLEYHKAPYDLDKAITMSELFDLWLPEYMKTLKSDKNATHVTAGWKYCHEIHDMCVRDVRLRHIKYVVYNSYKMDGDVRVDTTANIKMRIKSMFNRLYDWAVEHEYVEDNYARKFCMSKELEQEIEAVTFPSSITSELSKLLFTVISAVRTAFADGFCCVPSGLLTES